MKPHIHLRDTGWSFYENIYIFFHFTWNCVFFLFLCIQVHHSYMNKNEEINVWDKFVWKDRPFFSPKPVWINLRIQSKRVGFNFQACFWNVFILVENYSRKVRRRPCRFSEVSFSKTSQLLCQDFFLLFYFMDFLCLYRVRLNKIHLIAAKKEINPIFIQPYCMSTYNEFVHW